MKAMAEVNKSVPAPNLGMSDWLISLFFPKNSDLPPPHQGESQCRPIGQLSLTQAVKVGVCDIPISCSANHFSYDLIHNTMDDVNDI